MRHRGVSSSVRDDRGLALLTTLVITVLVAGSSASFIWLMHRLQASAGLRHRSTAALWLAEAGVHRALVRLESAPPEAGSGDHRRRPDQGTELAPIGALTGTVTFSVTDGTDGAIVVTSAAEVAGVTRRLRARVHLASPALLAAMYVSTSVRLDPPPAAVTISRYGRPADPSPWVHMAVREELWSTSPDVRVNAPLLLPAGPGPADPAGRGGAPAREASPVPIRILLGRDGVLTLHRGRTPVDARQLRAVGIPIEQVPSAVALLPAPEPDGALYRSRAAAESANAGLNAAAGKYTGDAELERKRDSLYTAGQFHRMLTYLASGPTPAPALRGIVFVDGTVTLARGQAVRIAEGALIVEGAAYLGEEAALEITHSPATRTLPGLVLIGDGGLRVAARARLRVHGLLYAGGALTVGEGAFVDIVGSLLSNDPGSSFQHVAGTLAIRYDAAVLGTPGLRSPPGSPLVAWISAWEELP